jgi:GntR family transcriptional repressor for pyruvate dehydrogenase complex
MYTIQKQSISDEVLEQIKNQIISGNWAPGEKIPSEAELTKIFGVSRVSIRKAISRLAGMGVLQVRWGEGTFVTEVFPKDYFSSLLPILMIEGNDLFDVLEFRSMIEVQSAGLAALRANENDIKRLEKINQEMKEKRGDYNEFAKKDLDFHTALSLATHNSVIVKVNTIIYDMLKEAMRKIVDTIGSERALHYHEEIVEAVKNKNSAEAMRIMKEHIETTTKSMTKGKDEKTAFL